MRDESSDGSGDARVRLLVVDDRKENLLAFETILSSGDYELVLVTSGDEALKQLLEHDFAAILIDVLMPGMDGFELATLIKQRERFRHTPIIFLTASDLPTSYRGYSVGAIDYMTKPIDSDVLRAKVAIFVELFRKDVRIRQQAEELQRAERREREHQLAAVRAAGEARYRNLAEAIPQIVWTADHDGSISYFNHRWADYTGGSSTQSWSSCVHADDRERCIKNWSAGLAGTTVFELEFRLRRFDGHYGWHLCRAVPEYDPRSGALVGWLGTFTDCDDLKRAADAAQQAVRVRDEFLSIASHELRTPLTTLALRLGGLEKDLHSGQVEDSRLHDKVGSARKQTSRLVALVDSLLSVSRITGGHLELQPRSFDLVEAANEVIDRFRELAETASVTLAFEAPGAIVGVWDRLRVEQILDNLIGNAIKYAPRAPVEVSVADHTSRVAVVVQDHGPGIPASEQERIFGPFERAVSSRHYGGLGLGLFIARQNAIAHGGSLTVISEPGTGARFVVELPRHRV